MDNRARTWACIIYEESAPSDWLDILAELLIPLAISPLHDRDVWTERDEAKNPEHRAGTLKKPHWHVVLYYGTKKSAGQVLEDLAPLGVRHVERIHEVVAYNRYLCHLDNPEKAQYERSEVKCLNGAACDMMRRLTVEQGRAIRSDILAFIRDNGINEYSDLVDVCELSEIEPEWSDYVATHTIFFSNYLRSRSFKARGVSERRGGTGAMEPEGGF